MARGRAKIFGGRGDPLLQVVDGRVKAERSTHSVRG